jgi:hypothetical protein
MELRNSGKEMSANRMIYGHKRLMKKQESHCDASSWEPFTVSFLLS